MRRQRVSACLAPGGGTFLGPHSNTTLSTGVRATRTAILSRSAGQMEVTDDINDVGLATSRVDFADMKGAPMQRRTLEHKDRGSIADIFSPRARSSLKSAFASSQSVLAFEGSILAPQFLKAYFAVRPAALRPPGSTSEPGSEIWELSGRGRPIFASCKGGVHDSCSA